MCSKPFRVGVAEFGCGQCMPCRINKRRMWTARMVLEAAAHPAAFFCTMTFDKDGIERRFSAGYECKVCQTRHTARDVCVRDAQLFLKRLRLEERVRYYVCGEYGDTSGRPHYHAMLFGQAGVSTAAVRAWPYGGVHVGWCTPESAAYISGYVAKGLTRRGDHRLLGRRPEFARMSLKPGIGSVGLEAIAKWCHTREGARFIAESGDVPRVIRFNGAIFPLGRYLTHSLRWMVNGDSSKPVHSFKTFKERKAVRAERTRRALRLAEEMVLEISKPGREAERVQRGKQAESRFRISMSKRGY